MAKTYQLSCLHYVDKKRKFNRRYNLFVIIITAISCFSFFLNHWYILSSVVLASLLESAKKFIPALCQPEEELSKLDDIATYFGEKLENLERIWNNHELSDSVKEEFISKELSKIQKGSNAKITEMNKLLRKQSEKEDKAIMDEADEYLKRKFYE